MTQPDDEQTGVSVITKYPFNQFPLRRMLTSISIDRANSNLPWGSHYFVLKPGLHDIEIGFRSWGRIFGKNHVKFDLVQGQTVLITYRTRYLAFLPGSISIS
jgi:hypothetical protein